jgi:hypothetical protein
MRRYEPPLVRPRAFWSEDEITADTRAMARLAQPDAELEPVTAVPIEPLAQVVTEAVSESLTPEPVTRPRKRKVKPAPPPCGFTVAWSPDGEAIGWKVDGKEQIEPLRLRTNKTKEK